MEGKEKRGVIVQSVARALTMISCFANDTELGISEIAERMDLSKSTTYGLVNTLTAFGYLEQTENKTIFVYIEQLSACIFYRPIKKPGLPAHWPLLPQLCIAEIHTGFHLCPAC